MLYSDFPLSEKSGPFFADFHYKEDADRTPDFFAVVTGSEYKEGLSNF